MKKIFKILSLILVLVSLFAVMPVCAVDELDGTNSSYVYDYWGNTVSTPIPYETDIVVNLSQFGNATPTVADMASDEQGNIYVADSANNCIWMFNSDLELIKSYTNYIYDGSDRGFMACEGCWVADGKLYVANTGAANIVVLDALTAETLQIIETPTSNEWSSEIAFEPTRLSTDRGGRV